MASAITNIEHMDKVVWKIIDQFFEDNPYNLVMHHLDSFNDFMSNDIIRLFRENNPIRWREDPKSQQDQSRKLREILLYIGGKDGTGIYIGKPVIYNSDDFTQFMYPNSARLKNMTYGVAIHYDLDVEFVNVDPSGETIFERYDKKVLLGRFPIMLHSNLCILQGLSKDVRYQMGECRQDSGGYFIIDGKEKCMVSQEQLGNNTINIKIGTSSDKFLIAADVRSVSEDASKPVRKISVQLIKPTYRGSAVSIMDSEKAINMTNMQLVVLIPNVKKAIPLFIVMRALGILSDYDIIEHCLLNMEKHVDMIELFRPSVHDAHMIFTQRAAIKFIASFTKHQTTASVLDILTNYFIPHVAEYEFEEKAYYIGHMVYSIFCVHLGYEPPTDRDSFLVKRVESTGTLLYTLWREYYLLQIKSIFVTLDREHFYHNVKYQDAEFKNIILNASNIELIFGDRIVEKGVRKAFKGSWGAAEHTKRVGIVQDLNRLSWGTVISHLRKLNLHMKGTGKITKPRLLHSTQYGRVDPVDTPDGGNIGTHKHLALSIVITSGCSAKPTIEWLLQNTKIYPIVNLNPETLSVITKVFVNGKWIGSLEKPLETVEKFKLYRRNGIIPVYNSIYFNYIKNTIEIFTDSGRIMRLALYRTENGKCSHETENLTSGTFTWEQLISGFGEKVTGFKSRNCKMYLDPGELYPDILGSDSNIDLTKFLQMNKCVLDYLDVSEETGTYIAPTYADFINNPKYTHLELHPSLMLGVMGNMIIWPEHNPYARNAFSCGQSKQAASISNTNAGMRIDKMSIQLNGGQIPLVKSRYLKYLNDEELPYGVNAIVAIASYTGYNVEDAILINGASLDRGMFSTSYFTMYESREESSRVAGSVTDSTFSDLKNRDVSGIKAGYDYSKLDINGSISEGEYINDKTVLVGNITSSQNDRNKYMDNSTYPKVGQVGYIDKSFMTEDENGYRVAKIRIRDNRIPGLGDKFASRAGQKGTIGLVLNPEDMPFTENGLVPDIVINPHALPSRMTIGHLIECVLGKGCSLHGFFGDCTAFAHNGQNMEMIQKMLSEKSFHPSGSEVMYNGMTGEQLVANIYIGPTYYMRLKHMVKDKINARARGARTQLVRQTTHGRAHGGGLRLGEMERDCIAANGMTKFMTDSMLVRGDEFEAAICNKTGTIAIYNRDRNFFMSPAIDGPIKFNDTLDGKKIIEIKTQFGRDFSLIKIPYAMKLFIQELQVLGVQMLIITDANIDQIANLSFASTITKESKIFGKLLQGQNVETDYQTHEEKIEELREKDMVSISDNTAYINKYDIVQTKILRGEPMSLILGQRVTMERLQGKLVILFIIIDAFPLENIWRSWIGGNENNVVIKIAAKNPNAVTSTWVRDRLVNWTYAPDWGTVEITKTMVRLLSETIQETYNSRASSVSNLLKYFCFASESCLPLYTFAKTVESVSKHGYKSWINLKMHESNLKTSAIVGAFKSLNPVSAIVPLTTDYYVNPSAEKTQFRPLSNYIRPNLIAKSDQWMLLTRTDAEAIISMARVMQEPVVGATDLLPGDVKFTKYPMQHTLLDGPFSDPTITASDEMYMATVLNLAYNGTLSTDPNLVKLPWTFTEWTAADYKHPTTFLEINADVVRKARDSGAMFARKFKYYTNIALDWSKLTQNSAAIVPTIVHKSPTGSPPPIRVIPGSPTGSPPPLEQPYKFQPASPTGPPLPQQPTINITLTPTPTSTTIPAVLPKPETEPEIANSPPEKDSKRVSFG